MQREIKIVVQVSNEKHAAIIRNDLIEKIRERTPIYFVSKPIIPKDFIDKLFEEGE